MCVCVYNIANRTIFTICMVASLDLFVFSFRASEQKRKEKSEKKKLIY